MIPKPIMTILHITIDGWHTWKVMNSILRAQNEFAKGLWLKNVKIIVVLNEQVAKLITFVSSSTRQLLEGGKTVPYEKL